MVIESGWWFAGGQSLTDRLASATELMPYAFGATKRRPAVGEHIGEVPSLLT